MGSEILLYGYTAVCVSMLIFNIVYYISLNRKDRSMERMSHQLMVQVEGQLDRLNMGGKVEKKHLSYLMRKLSRIANLIAFDKMMTGYLEQEKDGAHGPEVHAYYRAIQPVILHLAVVYRGREDMQAAYFAWFLAKHKLNRHMELDAVQDILVDYMNQDSLYCRVNAFKALCGLGSPRCVVKAVNVLDRNRKFFHDKLLTDSLLGFTGSHEELTELLLAQIDSFSVPTRLAVLNYIRFHSSGCCAWMLELMNNSEEDKELRLSAIRYFGRYTYEPAKPALLAFVADHDPLHWEYVAISATALAAYKGEEVIDALTGAIYSANWYVRTNAAASLTAQGVTYEDLVAVVGSEDRYVREMMLYQQQLRQAGGAREAKAV